MTAKPRAAIYARSATSPNRESIMKQVANCQFLADQQSWDVVMTAYDEGIPGTRLERPGLSQILALVASGGVDVIVADGAERFARSEQVLNALIATCKEHGTSLRDLHRDLADSPVFESDGLFAL